MKYKYLRIDYNIETFITYVKLMPLRFVLTSATKLISMNLVHLSCALLYTHIYKQG